MPPTSPEAIKRDREYRREKDRRRWRNMTEEERERRRQRHRNRYHNDPQFRARFLERSRKLNEQAALYRLLMGIDT